MRQLYTDEAGTSQHEHISVVVALIVHADTQWYPAYAALQHAFRFVPACYRGNFAFHAKEIWGSHKYRDHWSMESRIELLQEVMLIPRKLKIPISVGFCRRGWFDWGADIYEKTGLRHWEQDHLVAFKICMASADRTIRERWPNELASIVAERVNKTEKFLDNAINQLRISPIIEKLEHIVHGPGTTEPKLEFKIERIVDQINFANRDSAPLLQIADACAFGLRRFAEEQSMGKEFNNAISGGRLQLASANVSHRSSVFLAPPPP